jgi:hypothetical protein
MNAKEFLISKGIEVAKCDVRNVPHLVELLDEFAGMRIDEFRKWNTTPPKSIKSQVEIQPKAIQDFGITLTVGGAPMDFVCNSQVQLELVDALAGFLKHKGDASYLVSLLKKIKV